MTERTALQRRFLAGSAVAAAVGGLVILASVQYSEDNIRPKEQQAAEDANKIAPAPDSGTLMQAFKDRNEYYRRLSPMIPQNIFNVPLDNSLSNKFDPESVRNLSAEPQYAEAKHIIEQQTVYEGEVDRIKREAGLDIVKIVDNTVLGLGTVAMGSGLIGITMAVTSMYVTKDEEDCMRIQG